MFFFSTIAVAITWPLVTRLSTQVPGTALSTSDAIEHIRMIWWVRYAMQHGLNPFYQSLFGYPDGFFSTVQWAQPFVYWPPAVLSVFFGMSPLAAFNVWFLVTIALNGLAAYWLCHDVLLYTEGEPGTQRWLIDGAALLGAIVYMAFPTAQAHMTAGHVNIVSNYALPLLALSLYRIVTGRGSLRIALLGAVAIWVQSLTNSTALVFLLLPLFLFGGVYVLVAWWRHSASLHPGRKVFWQLAILLVVGGLLTLPFYLPLISDALNPARADYLRLEGVGWVLHSSDPLSFIALSPFTPWTRPFAPQFSYTVLNANFYEGPAYLGIVGIVLTLTALVTRRKHAWLWLLIMLGSVIFSLGPMLKWMEQPIVYTLGLDRTNIVMPWALFQKLPLLDIIRTPGRFNFLTVLGLCVLAALGLAWILEHITRTALRVAVTGGLAVIVLAEYQILFPFPTFTMHQPEYLRQLTTREDVRAVFDIPYDLNSKDALVEQIVHQKPILTGYYARRTPVDASQLTLLEEVARGTAWQAASQPDGTVSFPGTHLTSDQARTILKQYGVDAAIFHLKDIDKSAVLGWATSAFGKVAFQDDQIAVFEIPAPVQPAQTLAMTHESVYWWPFSPPYSGWWPDDTRNEKAIWLKAGARLSIYAPENTLEHFAMTLSPLLHARQLQVGLDGAPLHTWPVDYPSSAVDFWVPMQPGIHTLQLTVPDGCTLVPVVPTCLISSAKADPGSAACQLRRDEGEVCVSVQISGLKTTPSATAYRAQNIQLDNGLSLRGVRLPDAVSPGSTLLFQTDWLAANKLPGDYHVFFHMFSQDMQLLTQHDARPDNGDFPTTTWSAPQNWSEVVTLDIPANAAPGQYKVFAGWYRFSDMLRLGVHSDEQHAKDGLVYLGTVTVK